MLKAESQVVIQRPVEAVFDLVATRFFENYPRWSPEVVDLAQISPGPIGVGTRGRQARIDKGMRTESHFRVTEFEPDRRLAFEGLSDSYRVLYEFEPVESATRLRFRFEIARIPLAARPLRGMFRGVVEDKARQVTAGIRRLAERELPRGGG